MKKIAFYGGSFDPVHNGHLTIAERLTGQFGLDGFVLVPAFHAPHKTRQRPTSAYHRFAMLAQATLGLERVSVSTTELETPDRPYTIETLTRLRRELPGDALFFVMGADSWQEITTWREWERVLTEVDIIVVTRPGYRIGFGHVTDRIRERIVDLRGSAAEEPPAAGAGDGRETRIHITDAVRMDVSATRIRRLVREGDPAWREQVPPGVARHIEKYGLYDPSPSIYH